jgi:hypothetical protein
VTIRTWIEGSENGGYMREDVTGGWTKLHNGELHSLNSSKNIIGMTKSRRMKWAGP